MLRNKFLILALLGLISLSSCGIFHKGCNCPKFGEIKKNVRMGECVDLKMC